MSWDDDIALAPAPAASTPGAPDAPTPASSTVPSNAPASTIDAFKTKYGAAAAKAGAALGVDPSLVLGQWGEETAWGKKVIPGTNNLGNIKAPTGVKARDNQTGTADSYAKFDSPDAFADRYVDLIKTTYPGAVGAGNDPKKFTAGLQGYAQDPKYANKVQAASAAVGQGSPAAASDDWYSGVNLGPAPVPSVPPPDQEPKDLTAAQGLGLGARNVVTALTSPVTGVADLLNTGVNAATSGINKLAGTNIPQLAMPGQTVQNAMTAAGVPEAQTPFQRVVGDVATAGVGALTGSGVAGALGKVATNPVVRNAATELATGPLTQAFAAGAGTAAASTGRENGVGPVGQLVLGLTAGAAPLTVSNLLRSSDRATQNAAKLLQQAVKNNSPEDWNQARSLLADAQKQGIPLLGPEALPANGQLRQLTADVAAAPVTKNVIQDAVAGRAQQVQDAARKQVAGIGQNVGPNEAANAAQTAADEVLRKAQAYRTAAAGPGYKAQRAADVETMDLSDQLAQLPQKIQDLSDSRASAVQTAGKLHAFTNDQINQANKTIARKLGLAGDVKANRNLAAADQGKAGTYEAINKGMEYAAQIDASERAFYQAQDQLAQRNLPAVTSKVNSFLAKLDGDIRAAGRDTTEGKILSQYRNDLAPNGEPITLPSQLESVYKANRDKTQLGLNPTPEQRTTAGVIKNHLNNLDDLIQDVSPAIKNARQIYSQLSTELVDPLLKGPIGKIAGRGANDQTEAVTSRAMGELSGKNATPQRIGFIADQLGKSDKTAFPNLVRSYLEDKLNSSLKSQRGQTLTTTGTTLRDSLEGTPREAANVRAMIQKTAEAQGQDPTAVYQGFGRFLDVLDATGKLAMPKTTQPTSTAEQAATIGLDAAPAALIHGPAGVTAAIVSALRDMSRRGTYRKLATVMTSPTAVDDMRHLASLAPDDPSVLKTVASILTGRRPVQATAAVARAAAQTQPSTDEQDDNP